MHINPTIQIYLPIFTQKIKYRACYRTEYTHNVLKTLLEFFVFGSVLEYVGYLLSHFEEFVYYVSAFWMICLSLGRIWKVFEICMEVFSILDILNI